MTREQAATYQDVYQKLLLVEKGIQEVKALLRTTRVSSGEPICNHPAFLEGIWDGVDITDEDVETAKKSQFPYEHRGERQ